MNVNVEPNPDVRYQEIASILTRAFANVTLPAGAVVNVFPHELCVEDEDDDATPWELPVMLRVENFDPSNPDADAVGVCCAHAGTPREQATWLLQQAAVDCPELGTLTA